MEVWDQSMAEYIGYTEKELTPALIEFEKQLGGLVRYIQNNFREGDALKFNLINIATTEDRKENP